MKKIFLFLGIFSFLFASSQKNDLFDIEKHLQKKSEEDQKEKQKEELLAYHWPYIQQRVQKHPEATLSHVLPNGSKVYLLPQDNMPCIVPESGRQVMPNIAIQKDYAIKIPNVATPHKIIPEEKKKLPTPK